MANDYNITSITPDDTAEAVPEVDMGNDADRAILRSKEDDILAGLLAAAGYQTDEDNFVKIEIARKGKLLFAFHIRPLSEEEYNQCRKRHTKYIKNKNVGVRVPEDVDTDAYRSELIYQATIEEDRKKVWGQKKAWDALDVLSGVQLISKVLLAGEKDKVCEKIDEISGYSNSEQVEEFAKN